MNLHQKLHFHCLMLAGILLFAAPGSFAKDAKLRIQVKPEQAYVFVDGSTFGPGSRNISVAPGNHTIGVYNYGYKPEVRDVSLNEGTNAEQAFTLVAVPGSTTGSWGRLQIEGAAKAAVYLNGKTPEYFVGHGDEFNNGGEWFNCCMQQLVVPAGTHEVTVIGEHAKNVWSGSITVPANQRVILNVSSGKQRIKPWPEGAAINSLPRFTAGTASASIAIAPVSGSISAEPAQINCGDSSLVAWQTLETVQSAVSTDAETLKQAGSTGDLSVQPKKTTTYQMVASGPGGVVKSSTNVAVNPQVRSSIEASPADVRYRRIGDKVLEQGTSNLGWKATNANSVMLDPFGSVAADGTRAIQATPNQETNGPINEVHTYTLVASNECGGSNTQTASIRVTGSIEPIPEIPLASVFFPTGYPDAGHPKVGLVKSQQQALDRMAAGFKKYLEYDPEARLTIVGNADERDSNARNKPLSERRANLVKEYLTSLGIPENKMETVANGDSKQLDAAKVKLLHQENPNKVAKHGTFQDLVWAYNRRADIVLQPKDTLSVQYFPGDAPEANLLADSNWPGDKQVLTLAAEKSKLPNDPGPEN
ncbi:MAG: OmpA family protein [Candidatus Sulfotelmatobacter sp.]